MLAKGWIKPSVSLYSSSILFVRKKDWQIADVHRLLCTKCLYKVRFFPLPHIAELLDRLGKAKYFSSIDLANAYH